MKLLKVLVLLLCLCAPVLAFDQVESAWSDLKTFKTRDTFTLFYVTFPQGTIPETYHYALFAKNGSFYFKCQLNDPTEITDFETNFKTGAQEVGGDIEAICKSEVFISKVGNLTTTSNGALQTVLTYTVPAKETFHCEQWMIGRINTGNAEITVAQLQVNGTVVDGRSNASLTGSPYFEGRYAHPLPLANSGDIITIKVTPNAGGSTLWGARLVGALR